MVSSPWCKTGLSAFYSSIYQSNGDAGNRHAPLGISSTLASLVDEGPEDRATEREVVAVLAGSIIEMLGVRMDGWRRLQRGHDEHFAEWTAARAARLAGRTLELTGLRRDGSESPREISLSTWSTVHGRQARRADPPRVLGEACDGAACPSCGALVSQGALAHGRAPSRRVEQAPEPSPLKAETWARAIRPADRCGRRAREGTPPGGGSGPASGRASPVPAFPCPGSRPRDRSMSPRSRS